MNNHQQLLYEQPSSNNSNFLSQPQQPQYLNLKLDNTFAEQQQPSYKQQQQHYENCTDYPVDNDEREYKTPPRKKKSFGSSSNLVSTTSLTSASITDMSLTPQQCLSTLESDMISYDYFISR